MLATLSEMAAKNPIHTVLHPSMSNDDSKDIPQTLEDKQFVQINDKWKEICNTQNTKKIIRFWNENSNILSIKGSWYLKMCLLNDDIQSLVFLLDDQRSLSCINKKFGYGMHHNYTPIVYASRYCTFKVIQLLCSKGADVTLSYNVNILEYIFENAKIKESNIIECIECLVNFGCNVATNTIWCLSYYNAQRKFDRVYLASFLKEHGADLIHVTTAIKYGHLRLAKWLIQNKCKIYDTYLTDVKSEDGINLLIENGVKNINHNDNVYGTAIFYHSQRGNIEAVKALLNHNADKNILCTKDKLTALQIATKNKHEKIVELLTTNKQKQGYHKKDKNIKLKTKSNGNYYVDFSKIPTNPVLLENDIKSLLKYYDETNATAVLIENKIEALQKKLKKEYKKMLTLRGEQNERSDKIDRWKISLNCWNDFVSHWNDWDIICFVEWLKRINCWKTGSFETYFKSDQDAINKIKQTMLSDPLTFGKTPKGNDDDDDIDIDIDNKENDDDNITCFGKQLRAFDRYTLYKMGINETNDCNVIANAIQKLLKKRVVDNNNINDGSFQKDDDNLCIICWDRYKTHVLGCGHRFCKPDIKKIQKESNCCPICKCKITIVIKLY